MPIVTNAASWNQVLSEVSAVGAHLSEEEVSDFCSLLMLSERIFLVSMDARMASTRWLALNLEDFVPAVVVVDETALPKFEPTDTLLVVSGPGDDRVLLAAVQPAIASRALLLALAPNSCDELLEQVDAAITFTLPPITGPDVDGIATGSFTLLSVIATDAVRLEFNRRLSECVAQQESRSLPF